MFSPRTHILVCHGCGTFHEITTEFLSSPLAVKMPESADGRFWVLPNRACPDCMAESAKTPIINGRHTGRVSKAYDHGMDAEAKANMLAQWPEWEPKVVELDRSRR